MPNLLAEYFIISCDDEGNLSLSNKHEEEIWMSVQKLLGILVKDSQFTSMQTLFLWKEKPHHRASAKEAYSWRVAIEEIKNNYLVEKCKGLSPSERLLLADKPAMLKIAGETTNALLHSYTRGPTQWLFGLIRIRTYPVVICFEESVHSAVKNPSLNDARYHLQLLLCEVRIKNGVFERQSSITFPDSVKKG